MSHPSNPSDDKSPVNEVFHDKQYYFGDVIFRIEDCLFKVPRQGFQQHSEIFQTMFQLPPTSSNTVDGLSDEQPLYLRDIMCDDFRQLLKVMYTDRIDAAIPLSLAEWTSVLKLSTMWEMSRYRDLAIENITPLLPDSPIDTVVLSRTYDVSQWLLPSLNRLVQRAEPLSSEEALRLGLDTAMMISALRERIVSYDDWNGSTTISMRGVRNSDYTNDLRSFSTSLELS